MMVFDAAGSFQDTASVADELEEPAEAAVDFEELVGNWQAAKMRMRAAVIAATVPAAARAAIGFALIIFTAIAFSPIGLRRDLPRRHQNIPLPHGMYATAME
jgi:hypothetical protein